MSESSQIILLRQELERVQKHNLELLERLEEAEAPKKRKRKKKAEKPVLPEDCQRVLDLVSEHFKCQVDVKFEFSGPSCSITVREKGASLRDWALVASSYCESISDACEDIERRLMLQDAKYRKPSQALKTAVAKLRDGSPESERMLRGLRSAFAGAEDADIIDCTPVKNGSPDKACTTCGSTEPRRAKYLFHLGCTGRAPWIKQVFVCDKCRRALPHVGLIISAGLGKI